MSVEIYTGSSGNPHYRGVTEDTKMSEVAFHIVPGGYKLEGFDERPDVQHALHTNLGSLTVLNRMTGFGHRDIETGFRDPNGLFWLATGMCDVRDSGAVTVGEAIEWVKRHANVCVGLDVRAEVRKTMKSAS